MTEGERAREAAREEAKEGGGGPGGGGKAEGGSIGVEKVGKGSVAVLEEVE